MTRDCRAGLNSYFLFNYPTILDEIREKDGRHLRYVFRRFKSIEIEYEFWLSKLASVLERSGSPEFFACEASHTLGS